MQDRVATISDLIAMKLALIAEIQKITGAQQQPPGEYLRSREVRGILKISAASLQSLRISGKLSPVKIGGLWYYHSKEVHQLFKP
jgi:hypothetical protein